MVKVLSPTIGHLRRIWADGKVRRRFPPAPEIEVARKAIAEGDPEAALAALEKVPIGHIQAVFLKARLELYSADYAEGIRHTQHIMDILPTASSLFREAFFLQQRLYRANGQHDNALSAMLGRPFSENSARFFRNLRRDITQEQDIPLYEREMNKLAIGDKGWATSRRHHIMLLRDLGLLDQALVHAEKFNNEHSLWLMRHPRKPNPGDSLAQQKKWQKKAEQALLDVKALLDKHGIEFFLVSGTLLGCIREGQILLHDHDLDIGVDEIVSRDSLVNAFERDPRFLIKETYTPWTLFVEHLNGVNIDVFRHYMENDLYWHEGTKCRWWNTPFNIARIPFYGHNFSIPKMYKKYLGENYGDWEREKVLFNAYKNTKNVEIINSLSNSILS